MFRFMIFIWAAVLLAACSAFSGEVSSESALAEDEDDKIVMTTGTRLPRQDIYQGPDPVPVTSPLEAAEENRAMQVIEEEKGLTSECCIAINAIAPVFPEDTFIPDYTYLLTYHPYLDDGNSPGSKEVLEDKEVFVERELSFLSRGVSHWQSKVIESIKIPNTENNGLGRSFAPGVFFLFYIQKPDRIASAEWGHLRSLDDQSDLFVSYETSLNVTVTEVFGFKGVQRKKIDDRKKEFLVFENFVTFKNGTPEPESIYFIEPNREAKILKESQEHYAGKNGRINWHMTLLPGEEKNLVYTIEVPTL